MKTPKKRSNSGSTAVAEAVVQEAFLEPVIQVPVVRPEEKVIRQQSIAAIKQPTRLLLLVLLLGWIFDFLFWEQLVGVNFALLVVLSLIGGLYFLLSEGHKPGRNSLWLLIPLLFFAVITFVRRESLTTFLAYTSTLFSLGLFATNYLGGRWYLYRLSDYFYKFLLLIGDIIARPMGFFRQLSKTSSQSAENGKSLLPGLLRGLAIAVPIVLFFGSLLASADVVFNQKLDDFFDSEKIYEYIQRFVLIIIFAYLLAGIILHAVMRSADEKVTEEKKSFLKPFLGFTESAVVLGSVISLFLIFVMVQFRYFFGGETNIGVEGYTYSQYARRGFNELVMVAFFSLLMLVLLSTVTHRESEMQRRVYSGLNAVVVLLVMVILVSAYQRISLAIGWHGYSRLRLYPRIFLIWLGLLLITVAVLEIIGRERYFTFAAVLAALGFAVSLTLFNVDAAIVKRNVYRSWHGRNLNAPHLASLSTDAIPTLAEEFMSSALPTSTHEGVGAILACYKYFEDAPHMSSYDWRSFNYSSWRAHEALETIRPGLAGYVIRYNKYPVRVRTPHGVLYECRKYDAANDRE
jgi:hypothetical protein